MYSKGKGLQQPPQQMPISAEIQAKEKLAIYVYEYLMHVGAKNSAQTFLNEINWNKNIPLSEAPGFLQSWWCVFWDLYCAATPDRRDQFEPSNEAKVFHEYNNPQMGPQDPNMPGNPNQMMNPNQPFFPQGNPQPMNPMMNSGQPFQRFPHGQGQRPMRMPSNMEFNPNQNNQMNPNDPQARVAAGMSPLSRLTPPGGRMGPNGPPTPQQQPQQVVAGGGQPQQMGGVFNGAPNQMRGVPGNPNQPPPTPNMPPTPQPISNAPMSPMSLSLQQQQQQQQQQRWNQGNPNNGPGPQQQGQPNLPPPPPPHGMAYSAPSPISYAGGGVPIANQHGPGTPGLISSPQDGNGDMNFNNMMKNVGPGGGMQFQDQNLNHMVQMNPNDMGGHHGVNLNNDMIESMKNSPMANIQVNRHPDDHGAGGPMGDLNSYNQFGESVNLF